MIPWTVQDITVVMHSTVDFPVYPADGRLLDNQKSPHKHNTNIIDIQPAPANPTKTQTYDPAAYFYKVRNDRSLEDGPLAAVIARVANWDAYDPTLAHYLAYCLSLECDSLTTPAYAIAERLRWTPNVEYTDYDGVGLLMMHIDGNVVLAFRTNESFDRVSHDIGRMHQTTDSRLPARVALAKRHRKALKHNASAQLPRLARPEDEPLFDVSHDKVAVLSSLSNRYQARASEARSFVEDHLGTPIPILDAVRLMLAQRDRAREADKNVPVAQAPEFDGLSRYHTARPHIIVTGFGVGGAIAQLCALDMASLYGPAMVCTYTFGQCKLGNYTFGKLFARLGGRFFRIVNSFDPIPKLPKKILGLCHPEGSRVRYGYPPVLTREGYVHGTAKPSKRERLGLLRARGRGLLRGDVEELRLHCCCCGIQIPMRLTALEPFPFVVYRMVDDEPPQARDGKDKRAGRPPPRPELDLHQARSVLPWTLILRDLAPAQRPGMQRRLEVYSGSRQSPWSTYATPLEMEDEYASRKRIDEIEEPVYPDYTGPGTHVAPPVEPLPSNASLPTYIPQNTAPTDVQPQAQFPQVPAQAQTETQQKGRHIRFIAEDEVDQGSGVN